MKRKKNDATEASNNTGETDSDLDSSLTSVACPEKAKELESLAREGRWPALLELVEESHIDDWYVCGILDEDQEGEVEGGESSMFLQRATSTPLHLVMAHKPPVKVVEELINMLSTKFDVHIPEECPDDTGRTPLHLAAIAGCEGDMAQRFVSGPTLVMPAVVRDDMERTPLHWACCTPIKRVKRGSIFSADPNELMKWHKRQVIDVLLDNYPEGALVPDAHGKTPLDYARENQKSLTIASIKRLEREVEFYSRQSVKPSDSPSLLEVTKSSSSDGERVIPIEVEFDPNEMNDATASVGEFDICDPLW